MAYSELIKSFDRIRDYMREFYVYGFKSREEVDIKSARGYDNERRRIESWLGECMGFRHTTEGKNVFLSVDSRDISRNPLHKAFRAKSFTRNDIALHFLLMDILDGESLTVQQVTDRIASDHLSRVDGAEVPDESTVRKKLQEYARLGILDEQSDGRKRCYMRTRDGVDLGKWADAIAFYSEADSLGVIGSFLLERFCGNAPDWFRFKHHYLLRVLESEPLLAALRAIRERRNVVLYMGAGQVQQGISWHVTPVKILASTQTGRYYLCAYSPRRKRLSCYRMDHIRNVELLSLEPEFDARRARFDQVKSHLWGAGLGGNYSVSHVEMTVQVGEGEEYIVGRLMRERRCGRVEQVDASHWRFSADVYDPYEVGPWVRTFIGRITDFQCSDPAVAERFRSDVQAALAQYGGGEDAVQ